MAQLTTGLIDNTPVAGVRPTASLAVRITNDDTVSSTLFIEGFYVTGTSKNLYVQELITIPAGNVVTRNYYAQLDAMEFQFTASSSAVQTSVWGKDTAGNLNAIHCLRSGELNTF